MSVFILYTILDIGTNVALISMMIYFFGGGIVYLILGVVYHSHYVTSMRKRRIVKKILKLDTKKNPVFVDTLTIWLKREKFKLKINSYGNMYLKNKIAIISYFPSLNERISIISINNTSQYLIYAEDEELKGHIERYMSYIAYKHKNYKNGGLSESFHYEEGFTMKFSRVFFRGYGYIFLTISMYNVSSEYVPPFIKICIIISYFITEAS